MKRWAQLWLRTKTYSFSFMKESDITMSDKLFEIMEKHNCTIDEALEYLDREAKVISFLFNEINPYGQVFH